MEGATRFYGGLFGWTAVPVAGTDGYFLFQKSGRDVAALRLSDGPERWVPFLAVESADDMARRARDLGAFIVVPPADTPAVARTCVIEDGDGAALGLWEGRGHNGAHVQDEAGTMWWVELLARDIEESRTFCTALCGWTFDETLKYGPLYTMFRIGTAGVAGAVQYEKDWGVTQRWQVLFAIDDWKQTITDAARLGGEIGFWRNVPATGRLGTIRDPDGGLLCVMRPSRPDLRA